MFLRSFASDIFCVVVPAVVALLVGWIVSNRRRLPPGPRPLPLFGNLLQLPHDYQQYTLALWARTYGALVHARFGQTHSLVISSLKVAQDLLEKRSAKYSYRPRFTLHVEMMGMHDSLSHITYGDRFRTQRKWAHEAFQDKKALSSYLPLQRKEAFVLLAGLIESPNAFKSHLRRFAVALLMESVFGHTVTSAEDPFIGIAADETTAAVESGGAGTTFVDFVPILKYIPAWMPGAGFKRDAISKAPLVRSLFEVPLAMVKADMASGSAQPSLCRSLIETYTVDGELAKSKEDDIKGVCTALLGAGTDTTVAVLSTFILAMVRNPEVAKKAQDEIDRVIGTERLPDSQDRSSLPYLECVLKETYRWNTAVPLGVPHSMLEDDEYEGYHLPGRSIVIPNIWAMTHDPELYPDPDAFRPERFQGMDPQTAESKDPRTVVFGFGRRICPGRHFADTSSWLVMATVLAAFDISKAADGTGDEITPPAAFTAGMVSHTKPFSCVIRPRSAKAADMVLQEREHLTSNH